MQCLDADEDYGAPPIPRDDGGEEDPYACEGTTVCGTPCDQATRPELRGYCESSYAGYASGMLSASKFEHECDGLNNYGTFG